MAVKAEDANINATNIQETNLIDTDVDQYGNPNGISYEDLIRVKRQMENFPSPATIVRVEDANINATEADPEETTIEEVEDVGGDVDQYGNPNGITYEDLIRVKRQMENPLSPGEAAAIRRDFERGPMFNSPRTIVKFSAMWVKSGLVVLFTLTLSVLVAAYKLDKFGMATRKFTTPFWSYALFIAGLGVIAFNIVHPHTTAFNVAVSMVGAYPLFLAVSIKSGKHSYEYGIGGFLAILFYMQLKGVAIKDVIDETNAFLKEVVLTKEEEPDLNMVYTAYSLASPLVLIGAKIQATGMALTKELTFENVMMPCTLRGLTGLASVFWYFYSEAYSFSIAMTQLVIVVSVVMVAQKIAASESRRQLAKHIFHAQSLTSEDLASPSEGLMAVVMIIVLLIYEIQMGYYLTRHQVVVFMVLVAGQLYPPFSHYMNIPTILSLLKGDLVLFFGGAFCTAVEWRQVEMKGTKPKPLDPGVDPNPNPKPGGISV